MTDPAVIPQPHATLVTAVFAGVIPPKEHTYFWGSMCIGESRADHPEPLFLLCRW